MLRMRSVARCAARVARSPRPAGEPAARSVAGTPGVARAAQPAMAVAERSAETYWVSPAVRHEAVEPSGYRNVDGMRIDDGRYTAFKADVAAIVPTERIITDTVRKFAYGTDASFYRLMPQVVVKVHSEEEVQRILPLALKHRTPVTFRAAGTSLSGQAVTDSVMLKLSHNGKAFRGYSIEARAPAASPAPGRRSPRRLGAVADSWIFFRRREAR